MNLDQAAMVLIGEIGGKFIEKHGLYQFGGVKTLCSIESWMFWGTVWNWAKGQKWWVNFLSELNGYLGATSCAIEELNHIPCKHIGSPDFLIELATYLKEQEGK